MKKYEFNYSKKFSCIADKCKHNCCKGWQIIVDKKTADKYLSFANDNKRFENCLDGQFFKMVDENCPFLDGDNLCHVIKNYGEKLLCKTCKTHPRFKSFFNDRTETGLGLYCEHAGKIILSFKPKMKAVLIKDDLKAIKLSAFERKVLRFRKNALDIVQNRTLCITKKISLLTELANINLNKNSFNKWLDVFKSLDKLEINEFSFEKISPAKNFNDLINGFEREYEQLLSYLIFRHLSRAIDHLDLRVRLAFVLLSFNMINHILSCSVKKDFETLVEVCRFYSSEIETNDDNIYRLLNEIENLINFI